MVYIAVRLSMVQPYLHWVHLWIEFIHRFYLPAYFSEYIIWLSPGNEILIPKV